MAESLHQIMQADDRSAAWVSREAGIPYKRVLTEIVHRAVPLKLDTALAVAHALGVDLPRLIPSADRRAAS